MTIFTFLDFFGVVVFAISGALSAGEKRYDVFGVVVVAIAASIGGGTLRDLFLDSHPLLWIDNSAYLYAGIASAFFTFALLRVFVIHEKTLALFDAIGLAFFVMSGIQKTQSLGYAPEICITMGIITGVAGGILRDLLCHKKPLIFHREIYGLAALSGGLVYFSVLFVGGEVFLATLFGVISILAFRLAGIFYGLSLPAFLYRQ